MRRLINTAAVLWLSAGTALAQIASSSPALSTGSAASSIGSGLSPLPSGSTFFIPPVGAVASSASTLPGSTSAMPALPTFSQPTDPLITNYGVGGMQRPPGAPNLGIAR